MEGMTDPKPVQLPRLRPALANTRQELSPHVQETWAKLEPYAPKHTLAPQNDPEKLCLTYCGAACTCSLRQEYD